MNEDTEKFITEVAQALWLGQIDRLADSNREEYIREKLEVSLLMIQKKVYSRNRSQLLRDTHAWCNLILPSGIKNTEKWLNATIDVREMILLMEQELAQRGSGF